ncbi:GNAT family N-acetyltransferase [Pedobacter nototheniae]|uniref:GNAT family N-acetyltransferase n=1 Tax=Pedobacter nototheniae TaxID=2488994 RepID=UPI00292E569A|nr:GNAT family N-acetyltransferase [Pedobacter nototheniae]
MPILFQSDSIIIREFSQNEQPFFISLFEDEQVTQYLPYRPLEEYIELFRTTMGNYGKTPLGRWGIFNTQDNDFIGTCVIRDFKYIPGQTEIGYVLSRNYWGKGIATELSKALVDYCLTSTDAIEIVAITDLNNIASQKVLQKAGLKRLSNLKREGIELAYFKIDRHPL